MQILIYVDRLFLPFDEVIMQSRIDVKLDFDIKKKDIINFVKQLLTVIFIHGCE